MYGVPYIVLGTCIGPIWRPQHGAAYAAFPQEKKEDRRDWYTRWGI